MSELDRLLEQRERAGEELRQAVAALAAVAERVSALRVELLTGLPVSPRRGERREAASRRSLRS